MIKRKVVQVPGRAIGMTVPMALAATVVAVAPCEPDLTGLFWFSDTTGQFSEDAEAAYLLDTESAGPVLAVARLLGERCGDVEWQTTWTPDTGEGGDPGLTEESADLIAYQLSTTVAGTLLVSATCDGQSFGPIALTLLAAPVTGSCAPFDSTLELQFANEHGPIDITIWYDGTPCFYAGVSVGNDFDSRDVSACTYVSQSGVNRSFRAGDAIIFQPSTGMYSVGADDGAAYREIGVDFTGGHQVFTVDFS